MGKKKFGEKMANKRWKHDTNPWKPLLLIPYDVGGWPDLHGFEGEKGMNAKNTMNTMNTRWESGKKRGQTKGDN